MGYKLADGSDSDLYEVGDVFEPLFFGTASHAYLIRNPRLRGDDGVCWVGGVAKTPSWPDLIRPAPSVCTGAYGWRSPGQARG